MRTIKRPQQVNYPSLPTLILEPTRFSSLNNMRLFAPDSFQILPGRLQQPFDGSTPWNTETLKFDTALKRLAMEGQIHDSVYWSLCEVKEESRPRVAEMGRYCQMHKKHTNTKMEAFQSQFRIVLYAGGGTIHFVRCHFDFTWGQIDAYIFFQRTRCASEYFLVACGASARGNIGSCCWRNAIHRICNGYRQKNGSVHSFFRNTCSRVEWKPAIELQQEGMGSWKLGPNNFLSSVVKVWFARSSIGLNVGQRCAVSNFANKKEKHLHTIQLPVQSVHITLPWCGTAMSLVPLILPTFSGLIVASWTKFGQHNLDDELTWTYSCMKFPKGGHARKLLIEVCMCLCETKGNGLAFGFFAKGLESSTNIAPGRTHGFCSTLCNIFSLTILWHCQHARPHNPTLMT